MKTMTKLIYSAFAVVSLAIAALTANADPGDIFVSDVENNVIYKFTPGGTQSTFATGLNPYDLAFDSAGNLFVPDGNSGHIYKFAPDGTQTTFADGLYSPVGLAFDSAGYLFVSDYHFNTIYKFAPDGTHITFTTAVGSPIGLAFDSAGYLFEADGDSSGIYKFAPDGTRSFFATLLGPEGLAFDSAGYLFAPEVYTGKLYKFAPDGSSTIFATGLGNPTFVAIQPPPPITYAAQIRPPINADGSSVFSVRRGVVPVKFTLTQGGVATCALPAATIAVTRTAGGTIGTVDESVYGGPADTGNNFRIDSCQYVYNLSARALGVGIYRVDILINGQVVGSAMFALR